MTLSIGVCSALLCSALADWLAGGSIESWAGMRAKLEFALTIFGFVSAKPRGGS